MRICLKRINTVVVGPRRGFQNGSCVGPIDCNLCGSRLKHDGPLRLKEFWTDNVRNDVCLTCFDMMNKTLHGIPDELKSSFDKAEGETAKKISEVAKDSCCVVCNVKATEYEPVIHRLFFEVV